MKAFNFKFENVSFIKLKKILMIRYVTNKVEMKKM